MFEVLTSGYQVFHKRELDITKGDQKPSRRGGPVGKKGINEAPKKVEVVADADAVVAKDGDAPMTDIASTETLAVKRKAEDLEVEELAKQYVSKHAPGSRGHTSFLLFAKFHCRD
jgi:hypothetical protein